MGNENRAHQARLGAPSTRRRGADASSNCVVIQQRATVLGHGKESKIHIARRLGIAP